MKHTAPTGSNTTTSMSWWTTTRNIQPCLPMTLPAWLPKHMSPPRPSCPRPGFNNVGATPATHLKYRQATHNKKACPRTQAVYAYTSLRTIEQNGQDKQHHTQRKRSIMHAMHRHSTSRNKDKACAGVEITERPAGTREHANTKLRNRRATSVHARTQNSATSARASNAS